MANKEKLPWDLVDEILSCVPPRSLVRFQTVCKRWNALFNDRTFINSHKKTFQFILTTRSKIYSVSVNSKVEVRELTLDNPSLRSQMPRNLVDCNGFLLCSIGKQAVVWNPWLKQTRCIKPDEDDHPYLEFIGIGYDNNNNSRVEEIDYKTLLIYIKNVGSSITLKIHDFASDAWEDEELEEAKYRTLPRRIYFHGTRGVSLNGTLYFVAYCYKTTHPTWFILLNFNFSSKKFSEFCDLPCGKKHYRDALVLSRVFREDRFLLLKQCHVTKKIKIWVTKNKIDNLTGANVKWTTFMDVSIPNLPSLVQPESYSQPSYFLDDKRLVICSCDETGRAWIYVVGQNKLITKIQLDSVVDPWPLHCTYFPSLVLIPGGQREKASLQVQYPYLWLA